MLLYVLRLLIQAAAGASAGDAKAADGKADDAGKPQAGSLPLANASFHGLDEIPAPSVLEADEDGSEGSEKSLAGSEARGSSGAPSPATVPKRTKLDVPSSAGEMDGEGETSHESDLEVSNGTSSGDCIASVSNTLATVSDVLKQANRLSDTLPALEKGQPTADRNNEVRQSPECSSPEAEAPENFELPWSAESVSG